MLVVVDAWRYRAPVIPTRRTSSRPVMRVLDALGRRWALRILWELRKGPLTFRALRDACDGVSPSSLNHRLADLRALGVVVRGDRGYGLTPPGARLSKIVLALHRWAEARALLRRRRPATAKLPRRRML